MKNKKTGNTTEDATLSMLDQKAIFNEIMPLVEMAAKHGGGIDQILRKSAGVAAATLIKSMYSQRPDIALKAAERILDRTQGRPVERKISLTGDIMEMNERELDRQLRLLAKETGAEHLLDAVIGKALSSKTLKAKVVENLSDGSVPLAEFEDPDDNTP